MAWLVKPLDFHLGRDLRAVGLNPRLCTRYGLCTRFFLPLPLPLPTLLKKKKKKDTGSKVSRPMYFFLSISSF